LIDEQVGLVMFSFIKLVPYAFHCTSIALFCRFNSAAFYLSNLLDQMYQGSDYFLFSFTKQMNNAALLE
jgi:hypothetical protein